MAHTQEHDMGKHPKQDFQVERLAFFSDAVFAIAITLLIIEFKVPHITKTSTYDEVLHELLGLRVNFISLLLSYVLIASYWVRHHSLFKYIHDYNRHIVAANLASLLPIIFLPFTTAFFAECAENPNTLILGFRVFFLNHFFAATGIYVLYWLGMVRHDHLSYKMPLKEKLKFYEQTLFSSAIFSVSFIATFFAADANTLAGALVIAVGLRVIGLRLLKKRLTRLDAAAQPVARS
jgi:uncharacterized membrane protein